MTVKMATVTQPDGSFTYEFEDGIVFGPYGPGQCAAVHENGLQCRGFARHVGCHTTWADTDTGKFAHRWNGE